MPILPRRATRTVPGGACTRPGGWPSRSAWTRNATTRPGPATPMPWWRGSSPGAPGLTCSTSAAVPASRPASSRPPAAPCSASSRMRGWPTSRDPAACRSRWRRSRPGSRPAGRSTRSIAAQSWHWVDPVAGPSKAAQVLRPDGRLAIFGHVFEPPAEVAEPFAAAYRRVAPDSPLNGQPARRPLDLYQAGYAKFADKIRETGQFNEPEQWRFDWEQVLHPRPMAGPAAHHRWPHPTPTRPARRDTGRGRGRHRLPRRTLHDGLHHPRDNGQADRHLGDRWALARQQGRATAKMVA